MDAQIEFHPQPCLIWFMLFIPNVTCTFLSDAIVKDISYTGIVTILKAQGSWFSLYITTGITSPLNAITHNCLPSYYRPQAVPVKYSVNKEYSMCSNQNWHNIIFYWEDSIKVSSCGLADHDKTIQKCVRPKYVNSEITIFHWLY